MNRIEHLLTCLAEECAEVQQAVAKAQRFGLDDGYPGTDRTNKGDLENELTDLFAVLEMLEDDGILTCGESRRKAIDRKKAKVCEFMRYAEQRGTLTPNAALTGAEGVRVEGTVMRKEEEC